MKWFFVFLMGAILSGVMMFSLTADAQIAANENMVMGTGGGGGVGGLGTPGFIPVWTAPTMLGDSSMQQTSPTNVTQGGTFTVNSAGGADLVISESVADRNNAADQSFTFDNSGAGNLNVAVNGLVTVNNAAGTDLVISETGVDRNNAVDQSFTFDNSGAGNLNVTANGLVTVNNVAGTDAVFAETGVTKTSGATETFTFTNPSGPMRLAVGVASTGYTFEGQSTANTFGYMTTTAAGSRAEFGAFNIASTTTSIITSYGDGVGGNAQNTDIAAAGSSQLWLRVGDAGTGTSIISAADGTGAGQTLANIKFTTKSLTRLQLTNGGNLVNIGGHDWTPDVDNTGNLGTAALRWLLIRGVTITAGDLHLQDEARDVHWVLREEEEGISVINKKTGKRYRMMLAEDGEESITPKCRKWWQVWAGGALCE